MAKKPPVPPSKKKADPSFTSQGMDVAKAFANAIGKDIQFQGNLVKGGAKSIQKAGEKVGNIKVKDVVNVPGVIAKRAVGNVVDIVKTGASGYDKVIKAGAKLGSKLLQAPENKSSGAKLAGKARNKTKPTPKSAPKSEDTSKKGPSAGGKSADRRPEGGTGSSTYPKTIPNGYRVMELPTNPPKYKLVPKSIRKGK